MIVKVCFLNLPLSNFDLFLIVVIKMAKRVVRHRENPFLSELLVPVRDKQVQISKLGVNDNILINQQTGEVSATHLITYKRVDADQFLKLFTRNIALTFDLTSAGIKAFSVLAWSLQTRSLQKDKVLLDKFTHEEFLAQHEDLKLSLPTFWRGLSELEKARIIAKSMRPGEYFINPNFVFNGDRIAFTTMIEREGAQRSPQQADIKPLRVVHEDGTVDDKPRSQNLR